MSGSFPQKPSRRPKSPCFSSGPCAKRPGWSLDALKNAAVGRSHRAKIGKDRLKQVIDETKAMLGLPEDYVLGIMPASDTGAIEAALWSLLGPRPVDVFAWETFSKEWMTDCVSQLKSLETRVFVEEFGKIPDLRQADFDHDIVFAWNGTTSGVIVPNGDWIASDRKGLTLCDATSAIFAVPMPWDKLDVVTFSWQKALGGEAQHGMLILSPRAVERLETHTPAWPMPKIFRLTEKGKLKKDIFEGATINTPSMLCVEDMLDALDWARSVGGAEGLARRTKANFGAIERWVERARWIGFLTEDSACRSPTSVCLKPFDPEITALDRAGQVAYFKKIAEALEAEGVAYDIGSYRDAPPGLRIWCGATIEKEDVEALAEWIDWARSLQKMTGN